MLEDVVVVGWWCRRCGRRPRPSEAMAVVVTVLSVSTSTDWLVRDFLSLTPCRPLALQAAPVVVRVRLVISRLSTAGWASEARGGMQRLGGN